MIEIVEGRGVGAGKSYYVCTRIIQTLAAGGTVFASTSFGLNFEATASLIRARYGVVIEADQYHVFEAEETWHLHEVTPPGTDDNPVLIVLDEAHAQLNARDWADTKKRPFFNWLTQSRHDNNDLIFITQHSANIDKQIARLVTYFRRIRNMSNFAIPGFGKWPLKQFVIVTLDQDGKTVMDRKWVSHDKGVFACYRSKVMGGSHSRSHAPIPRKKLSVNSKKKHMVKVIVIVLVLVGGVTAWRWFNKPEKPKAVQQAAVAAPLPSPAVPSPVTAALPARAYDVVEEEFRGTDEESFLRTSGGQYEIGAMCRLGLVAQVKRRSALCVSPEGRRVYVIARERGEVSPSDASIAQPVPAPVAEPSSADSPMSRVARGLGGYPMSTPVADL